MRPQHRRVIAEHGPICPARIRIRHLALMHDDFAIGEEVPVGRVIEVQMTQHHEIHILGRDTELCQRVDDGGTLVITGGVEKQPPPTCGGNKVATAPAKEATTAFTRKATEQHFDVCHEELLFSFGAVSHPPATLAVLLGAEIFSAGLNPYSRAGFSTRMRRRISASGAHMASRSSNSAAFGMAPLTEGCGQSLPQTMRDASASINARAKGTPSW